MPVTTAVPIQLIDEDTFYEIDYRVRGIAFAIHNDFGRFFDERIYRQELVRRGLKSGLEIVPEMRMSASIDNFRKDYFADCLVNASVVVETKAVMSLADNHRGQTLNYLFLCGLHHGTLLNFRGARLQHEFVSSKLTTEARRRHRLCIENFKPLSPNCEQLPTLLRRLALEWGMHLDPTLYRDALFHLLNGGLEQVGAYGNEELLGFQEMATFAKGLALLVTAFPQLGDAVHEHHARLLKHTTLRGIQWVNFHHETIEIRTIERS